MVEELLDRTFKDLFMLASHYGVIEQGEKLALIDLLERVEAFLKMMKDRTN